MRLVLAAAVLMASCGGPPLPSYGEVPDFVLTAQSGQEFHGRSLAGKIWVADFIFTTCPGPCPRMSAQMRRIQEARKKVSLVSFTVDPDHDSPRVLAEYAGPFHADPARWVFLTGPRDTLHVLIRDTFKLGDVKGVMDHSTKFVLVDGQSQIRGYYSSDAGGVAQLVADVRRL